ncbi:hypothetical protein EMIT0P218_450004 [Pseudomonas sp. IT-P218]
MLLGRGNPSNYHGDISFLPKFNN